MTGTVDSVTGMVDQQIPESRGEGGLAQVIDPRQVISWMGKEITCRKEDYRCVRSEKFFGFAMKPI